VHVSVHQSGDVGLRGCPARRVEQAGPFGPAAGARMYACPQQAYRTIPSRNGRKRCPAIPPHPCSISGRNCTEQTDALAPVADAVAVPPGCKVEVFAARGEPERAPARYARALLMKRIYGILRLQLSCARQKRT
jgi:hypothetical protein